MCTIQIAQAYFSFLPKLKTIRAIGFPKNIELMVQTVSLTLFKKWLLRFSVRVEALGIDLGKKRIPKD